MHKLKLIRALQVRAEPWHDRYWDASRAEFAKGYKQALDDLIGDPIEEKPIAASKVK